MLPIDPTLMILAAADAAAKAPSSVPAWTLWIDQFIRLVALAGAPTILIVSFVRLLLGKRLPLSERPNAFRADSVFLIVAAYFLSAMVAYGLLELCQPGWPAELGQLVASVIAQLAAMFACYYIVRSQFAGGLRIFVFGSEGVRQSFVALLAPLVAILAIGLCEGIAAVTVKVAHYFVPDHVFEPHRTLQALRDPDQPPWVIPVLWLSAVVFAPVVEESFFRGLVQTLAASTTRRPWLAIGFTSLFFALVHWSQIETVPAIFMLGFLLGYVYEKVGRLWPVIAIHALFNLRTMVWVSLGVYAS